MSSGPHPSGDSTDDHLQVQNHHDWVARDFLVLGSGESVHKTSSKTSLGVNLLTGNSIVCIPISVLKTSVVIGSDLKLGPTVVVTVLLLYKYVFSYLYWYICSLWLVCLQCWMYL